MVRRLNKNKIKFGETMPNNMEPKRPGSRVDMSQATIDYQKGGGRTMSVSKQGSMFSQGENS